MTQILLGLAQVIVVAGLAPLMSGTQRWIAARVQGRRGPGVLQDYRDLAKLLSRQSVRSLDSTIVTRIMPMLVLAAMVILCLGMPILTLASPVVSLGNIVVMALLLAAVRLGCSLAALDSGDPYASRGQIRALGIDALAEPTLVLALFVAALSAGSVSSGDMSVAVCAGSVSAPVATVLAAAAFICTVFIELGEAPFDMGNAQQEMQGGLASIYSGPALATLRLALSMRQMLLFAWFFALFCPWGAASFVSLESLGSLVLALAAFVLKMGILTLLVGVIGAGTARVRFGYASRQVWAVFGVAMLALAFLVVGM